jgi:arylsulfatase
MMGDRSTYRDSWMAGTKVMRAPWELYHLEEDWTLCEDLASMNPGKLQEARRARRLSK